MGDIFISSRKGDLSAETETVLFQNLHWNESISVFNGKIVHSKIGSVHIQLQRIINEMKYMFLDSVETIHDISRKYSKIHDS
jgi:hypothetical protein